jgi:hypothetical protein
MEDWVLLVVPHSEPFSGFGIVAAASEWAVPRSGDWQHLCALVDLRAVDVLKLSASDSHHSVGLRKTRIRGRLVETLGIVLKDLREKGTVRMHNQ